MHETPGNLASRYLFYCRGSGRISGSVECQAGRFHELDVRDDFPGDHRIEFLRAERHRLDALRRELFLHRRQRERLADLGMPDEMPMKQKSTRPVITSVSAAGPPLNGT